MLKRLWKIILFVVVIAALAFSCSPQKRLDRLIKKHPELSDTIRKIQIVELPAYHFDTTITQSMDTTGLAALLKQYRQRPDTNTTNKIIQYVINRPFLDGPVRLPVQGGGVITLTPGKGGQLTASWDQAPRKVPVSVPMVVFKYSDTGINWKHICITIVLMLIIQAVVPLALRFTKSKQKNG